jgi:hypothetical protein
MIKIEFSGYVNEILVFDWGTIAKISHQQQRKNDKDQWETVGYDRFDVICPDGVVPAQGDIVAVTGRMKSKEFEKRDGTKGLALEVRADSIEPIKKKTISAPVTEDLPF